MTSPGKFVKPADLFNMRRKSKGGSQEPAQSPMKCLNNLADPSPTKNLPTILKNPFNQPVKRKLNLCSPVKKHQRMMHASPIKKHLLIDHENSQPSPTRNLSPTKQQQSTPRKRCRMSLGIDEDANLEAPKLKYEHHQRTPSKRNKTCYNNDWKLRTKLKINFTSQCKNWEHYKPSTHKRHSGSLIDDDSPSKVNDNTISIEAIKNASTVYQHPYFSWMQLYPRKASVELDKKRPNTFYLSRHEQAVQMLHKDWCESLDDLVNLLIDGRCPFFYVCSDFNNVLFQRKKREIRAYISPISYCMSSDLKKAGIELTFDDDSGIENDLRILDEDSSNDLNRELDVVDDDAEASVLLEDLGIELTARDFPQQFGAALETRGDSNSQSTSKSTSTKPLATIEGVDNIKKLVKFLQSNKIYTVSNIGEFSGIPPTLLSPREFRLSTPHYPEVTLNQVAQKPHGAPPTPPKETLDVQANSTNCNDVCTKDETNNSPTFIELRGTILPNLYKKLHKLLLVSENSDHTCSSTQLESSIPFGMIHDL